MVAYSDFPEEELHHVHDISTVFPAQLNLDRWDVELSTQGSGCREL